MMARWLVLIAATGIVAGCTPIHFPADDEDVGVATDASADSSGTSTDTAADIQSTTPDTDKPPPEDVVVPPIDTGPVLPEPGCVGDEVLLACESGRGPSGLGDAVWICRDGTPTLTTCWEHCRDTEGLVRTNGCTADGVVSCTCTDDVANNQCQDNTTEKVCAAPTLCQKRACTDQCDGQVVGCGHKWTTSTGNRVEGCLCACETGDQKCDPGWTPCNAAPECPGLLLCQPPGVFIGVTGSQWCAAFGLVADENDTFCYEDLGEYLCVPPDGCEESFSTCVSDQSRVRCDGGEYTYESCWQVCQSQGHDASTGCSSGQCQCWDDPCKDPPTTPWSCSGSTMWRCDEGNFTSVDCDDYCTQKGLIHNELCIKSAGNRVCGCVSKAQANCSTGYWSDGGASCNTYWNGAKCCESCVMFGSPYNTCD